MTNEQLKTATKLTENLYVLESDNCIEIGEKPNRNWRYDKIYDLSENIVFYHMYIFTEDSVITSSCDEEEFPLYYVNLKELRREKLERLKAISN